MKSQTTTTSKIETTILNHKDRQPMAFQYPLINIHLVGIRSRRTGEIVFIQYISATKVGFIYEGGGLTEERVLLVYKGAPDNYNDIRSYEFKNSKKREILYYTKDNYVFIGERLVQKIK